MLNRGVHSVFIPVENFVGDVIVNASEITLSKCICIYQYRSTANPDLTFAALEEIVEFNIPGRKTDFTKDAKIVCQASALNEGKPHASAIAEIGTHIGFSKASGQYCFRKVSASCSSSSFLM